MGKALILGGNGFIGSAIARKLVKNNVSVKIMDRGRPNIKNLGAILDKIDYIERDFLNEKVWHTVLENVENVFHCITSTYPGEANKNPIYDIETNVVGTVKMLEILREYYGHIKLFFLSSGGTVYGSPEYLPIDELHNTNPISSYGIAKLAIEKYIDMHRLLYGLNYLIFRVSNPYGETQTPSVNFGVIATFLHKALKNEIIEVWGDGNNVRDYIYIEDLADAIVLASEKNCLSHNIYNVGSGIGKSINEILYTVKNCVGIDLKIKFLPKRSFDIRENFLDTSRIENELKWYPKTSLEAGIKKVWSCIAGEAK
jgi:UDP-glucose 4-epimerase